MKGFMTLLCLASCAVLVAMLVVSCGSSVQISHDYDQQANFNGYRTFAWLEQPTNVTGDAKQAQTRNSLLDQRIKRAVNAEMIKKGMELNASRPDLLLVYHTGIQDKIDVTDWGYRYGGSYWGGYGGRDVTVSNYQEGTLILDMIDNNSKELVFRTSATGTVESNPDPEKVEKNIQEVVAKMLQLYPPK